MGFKLKPAHIALLLIIIYIVSMLPSLVLRQASITLPKENIINYTLTQAQENYATQLGKTILTFEYDANCEPCLKQLEFLEKIATEEKDQIILQEIPRFHANSTRLKITSYRGEETLRNPDENKTWDALCFIMVNPPISCSLREI